MLAVAIAKRIGARKLVTAHVYGHDLLMPIEHSIGPIMELFPNFNRPLALTAQAIAERNGSNPRLVVVDVGANIGDSVALIEEKCSGIGQFLCIEPDPELAELCKINFPSDRVRVERCLIGENEGMSAWLNDDEGRANPSTRLIKPTGTESSGNRLVRLDTVAAKFAQAHGALDLIKVDTEGYDFSVLRSASRMLEEYRPALYFEWYPKLLREFDEQPSAGFVQFKKLGYSYYAFFTNQGHFYCSSDEPDPTFLGDLETVTLRGGPITYFDVFASTDKRARDRIVELSSAKAP